MKFFGDFHIHSHFSMATSKLLNPEYLDYWAKIKGIKVIGTGDFSHPGWLKELKEKLEPAEQGLYKLKNEYVLDNPYCKNTDENKTRFVLSAEISNIYKKTGKVRKVHNCFLAPDFETVEKVQRKFKSMNFNITSDGRPILGLDSGDLLEIMFEVNKDIFFFPAHIWTPWFSALGDKSGFDTIEECYGDLSEHIFAVETGLSTDPPMNWACSFLDKYNLLSNSDAHSPEKLGRNANIFDTQLSYDSIIDAMKTGNPDEFLGTIDFFPQEGKYHFDGHRKCGVKFSPLDTLKNKGICPVCGRKITIGVTNRIAQLSDRDDILERKNRLPFYSLIPLKEMLAEIHGVGVNSKKITHEYNSLILKAGSEFNLLFNFSLEKISRIADYKLAEAIKRMRERKVFIKEGFDGEYGKINVFSDNGFDENQNVLFDKMKPEIAEPEKIKLLNFDLKEYQKLKKTIKPEDLAEIKEPAPEYKSKNTLLKSLNPEQIAAAEHRSGTALVLAGPGTGKTRVLVYRFANLVLNKNINPENILALTFTNKAANEMKERLAFLLKKNYNPDNFNVSTFHALGLRIIKEQLKFTDRKQNFLLIDEDEKKYILEKMCSDKSNIKTYSNLISKAKQFNDINIPDDENFNFVFKKYQIFLIKNNLFDLDDLISYPILLLKHNPEILKYYREKFQYIMIDEYQDTNLAQYKLIKLLMPGKDANLFVIGDPNQAIYGFRGADVKFIENFIIDYPETKTYNLKKSYRCTDNILKASSDIINKNKSFLKGLAKGVKINIAENATDKSEAEFVARKIESMIGGLRFFSMDSSITQGDENKDIKSLSDFVVLCRLTKQFKAFEKAFNDHSIPYQIIGEKPFFKSKPIADIISIFKYYSNRDDIFMKNYIADKKIIINGERLKFNFTENNNSVESILKRIIDVHFSNQKEKYKNSLDKLIDISKPYGSKIEEFLDFISLGSGADLYNKNAENVTLMTMHASKGLEFNCVFIVGCENGIIPYSLFENQKSDIDEERRLLYVAMTRAKKHLFLTNAKRRFIMGKEYNLTRSPFLDKIEKELIKQNKSTYKKPKKKEDNQMNLF